MPQSSKIPIKVPPHLLPVHISVFGYGVTSKPFVEFINSLGKTCSIYDDRFEVKSSDECGNALLPPSAFDEGKSSLEFISPGILPTHSYFSKARNPIGEYDYAYKLMRANDFELKSIWISGTNGKTTTTQMLTHLLESFGALCGGNIGTPLTTLALKHAQSLDFAKKDSHKNKPCQNPNNHKEKNPKKDSKKEPFWVLESSSFAMHYSHIATPQIYLLLPLSQDHISWHSGYEGYIEDKLRVLARMGKDTCALLPQELKSHKIVQEYIHKNHSKSDNEHAERAIFYRDSSDLAKFLSIELDSIPFGEPFLLDALVALSGAVLAQKMGLLDFSGDFRDDSSPAYFLERLKSFHIGAHRIEEFYEPYNQNSAKSNLQWLWVDDSKGTNTDATLKAFARYKGRHIYALLGGDDKGADIEPIFALIADGFCKKNSFVKIFAIGSNEKKILSLAQKYGIPAFACQNLKNAMKHIKSEREKDLIEFSDDFASEAKSAQPKSTQKNAEKHTKQKSKQDSKADFIASFVGLLSPAAASLDQFRSYKERGELFKKYALES
ncbi:Mur ligase family protein [Helicobacter macacae]|uniref:UDP-N-acetylmuramoylalanine--D-glutamate ligase n=1 Tax=Helicobacter macacae MIT 99-5501 TaxID=1357400 RepID=V8C649_9HELI|nr:Mur ligase family protein [Helicobacter macacae]ETD22231.1 hypothetical protein HMPREF2086_01962 [Helicobacter macacae MIT 99-5501]